MPRNLIEPKVVNLSGKLAKGKLEELVPIGICWLLASTKCFPHWDLIEFSPIHVAGTPSYLKILRIHAVREHAWNLCFG